MNLSTFESSFTNLKTSTAYTELNADLPLSLSREASLRETLSRLSLNLLQSHLKQLCHFRRLSFGDINILSLKICIQGLIK